MLPSLPFPLLLAILLCLHLVTFFLLLYAEFMNVAKPVMSFFRLVLELPP